MEFQDVMAQRHSVRAFTDQPVSDAPYSLAVKASAGFSDAPNREWTEVSASSTANEEFASLTGVGSVNYYGDPEVTSQTSGLGSVKAWGPKETSE
jgi:hypothetical protein